MKPLEQLRHLLHTTPVNLAEVARVTLAIEDEGVRAVALAYVGGNAGVVELLLSDESHAQSVLWDRELRGREKAREYTGSPVCHRLFALKPHRDYYGTSSTLDADVGDFVVYEYRDKEGFIRAAKVGEAPFAKVSSIEQKWATVRLFECDDDPYEP